jgi:acid stress-induced BolA-like protein IbaG/YrbA
MATIPQQEEQRLKLLEQIEAAEKRINAQNEKIAVSKDKEAKRLEKKMQDEKKSLDILKEELKTRIHAVKLETFTKAKFAAANKG